MSAPPWGHKPPAVDDEECFWIEPPPVLSPRVEYWLKRLAEGTWKPNRHFRGECYHCRTVWLGVYIWEYQNIIAPVLADLLERERQAA
jgi:hypothetical protein